MLRTTANLNKLLLSFKPQFGNLAHIDILERLTLLRQKEKEIGKAKLSSKIKRLRKECNDLKKIIFYQLGGNEKLDAKEETKIDEISR